MICVVMIPKRGKSTLTFKSTIKESNNKIWSGKRTKDLITKPKTNQTSYRSSVFLKEKKKLNKVATNCFAWFGTVQKIPRKKKKTFFF